MSICTDAVDCYGWDELARKDEIIRNAARERLNKEFVMRKMHEGECQS